MRSAAIPEFLPSRHGFRFVNRWPAGPAFEWRAQYLRIGIGEVAEGLCGGMCFAAADRFLRDEAPPPDTAPPAAGSPLFREIARRQWDSLELGLTPLRFWTTAARVRLGAWPARAQVREWRAIRAEIDAGRPASIGLVRSAGVNPFALTKNHQVLGYAYEAGPGDATLRIYDPNWPGHDDVEIEVRLQGVGGAPARGVEARSGGEAVSLRQSTGEPLLAVLHLPYRPSAPRPQP